VGFDNLGNANPEEKISINVGNQKIAALAFLHTCTLEEPGYTHRKIGNYIIEYTDGNKEIIDLTENWNITDIRSSTSTRHNAWTFNRMPDLLLGSERAWTGKSAMGVPLNLQQIVWTNPHPEKLVKHVIFTALNIKQRSRMALVGLTLLK